MNISEIIKQKREEKGLSVEELSSQTMLSIAIINDLENGNFDHYQGEEAYMKMYLRKICRALDIDEKEVQNEYLNLTQKIELEELQEAEAQSEHAKKKLSADEEKAKAFRFEKPSFTNNKGVVGDKSHLNVIRVIIIILLVAMIFCVGFFAISKTKSKANVPSFTSNQQTAAGEVTKKPSKKKTEKKKVEETVPAVTYTRNSDLNYNFKLKDPNAQTFKLKVEYSKKCWGSLYVNRTKYTRFEGKVYNEGDSVEVTLNTADFNTLRLVSGEQSGVKVYVDDVEVPLTDEEKTETGLKYTNLTLEK
ncbi:helix-turn-helix domain-containing protein [Catenibacterium sp.]|uniref:helix-turn-helix domain-containing protein n=1 Tax=Catenibacterium sp. TaxID=2049022 RepID=UPI003FD7AE1E